MLFEKYESEFRTAVESLGQVAMGDVNNLIEGAEAQLDLNNIEKDYQDILEDY